jgi:hypothetical protein
MTSKLTDFRNMEGNETLLFEKGDGIELTCKVRCVERFFTSFIRYLINNKMHAITACVV